MKKEYDERGEQVVYIDLKPYFLRVAKGWKTILVWALCGALLGVVIGLSKPKTFTTTAVVAPEITTRSSLGSGLSSLASLAGVNMNSLALTDAMHPDLYPVVINSVDFYLGLLDMPVSFTHAGTEVQTDLYDYVAHYTKTPWYAYVLGLPRMAIDAVKGLFEKKSPAPAPGGEGSVNPLLLDKQKGRAVKFLMRSVKATVEKRTYVLSVTATMQDRVVAAQLANAVVDHLQQFVIDYRTEKARENVAYFEKIYEETHEAYLAAQRAYAHYADAHLGSLSRSSQVQQQLLQNEAQLRYQIYNSTAQNLLSARAKVQQEAPVLVVIQHALAPINGKPSKVRLAMIWLVLGGIVGICVAALRKEDGPEAA